MKVAIALIALLLWLVTIIAVLALYGVGGTIGTTVHQIPAACLLEAADALHLYIPPDGPMIRSADGPPFLGPVAILLIYAVPAAVFTLIANRWRFRGPSQQR